MPKKSKGLICRIAGVSGTGKTTINALVGKILREASLTCRQVDTKTILCELAGVENEKQYREMPEVKRRVFFPLLMQRISEIADAHPEFVWSFERHLCSMSKDGNIVERGVVPEHGERMVGLAVIIAREHQIAAWRQSDKVWRKDRHLLSPEQIIIEQLKELELVLDARRRYAFPVQLVINEIGQEARTAKEIFSFLEKVSS